MTMIVYVNDRPVHVLPGSTVKHALTHERLLEGPEYGKIVYDEWGNELGLDGALSEGTRIYFR